VSAGLRITIVGKGFVLTLLLYVMDSVTAQTTLKKNPAVGSLVYKHNTLKLNIPSIKYLFSTLNVLFDLKYCQIYILLSFPHLIESITCPGSYLCAVLNNREVRKCISMTEVCDGKSQCPAGDDEISCGKRWLILFLI
jgi:hypothetical protein